LNADKNPSGPPSNSPEGERSLPKPSQWEGYELQGEGVQECRQYRLRNEINDSKQTMLMSELLNY